MMKNIIKTFITTGVVALLLIGCEKDIPKYSYEQAMLNFIVPSQGIDSIIPYTFFFENEDIVYDTIWCTVQTLGFPSDQDRPFKLKQTKSYLEDAVSGVHYVPFDDPQLQKYYFIPKNETKKKIPVVLKRDVSLKEKNLRLHITFEDNGFFTKGFESYSIGRIDFTDRLTKPKNWSSMANYYFGSYGLVKHQFMIDNSDFRWDDKFFIEELNFDNWNNIDQPFLLHLAQDFAAKLAILNEERKQQGEDVLREDNGNGIIVSFESYVN